MNPNDTHANPTEPPARQPTVGRAGRPGLVWGAGLLVALGAAVATAHGLFEVATAAGAPPVLAGLYPLITDGLALVAYAATTRLAGSAARYAWTVVVLAAGLSGLAQAAFLAGGVGTAPAALRFGIGAWPAIAAAIVAHLLYLLATTDRAAGQHPVRPVQPQPEHPGAVQRVVQPAVPTDAEHPGSLPDDGGGEPLVEQPPTATERPDGLPNTAPARERARCAARRHAEQHGALPTVSRLMALAEVARGTAAAALQDLRAEPAPLRIVTTNTEEGTES